jgi:PBSX family phage terminase large subunit
MSALRFSPRQIRLLTWWCHDDGHDAVIADGSVRSGKTLSMGMGFFFWAMRCFDGQQFALCGKTIGALRRNLLRDVLPRLREAGFSCTERRTDNAVTVRFGGRENRFLLFGGRDESSAALIQGSTFAGVLLDEAALMPRSFVEQATARCSVPGSRLWFNCNPEGPQHWFYREWILRAEERRALYLHFTMDDNPSLTPRVRARYKSSYSGVFYRRFVLGEWVAAEGLVYDFFDRERDAPPPPADCRRWRVSADYGTSNPASFGLWGQRDGVWYRVAEYYYDSRAEGRQKTDAEYVEDMKRLIGKRPVEQIVADPSAASFLTALRRAGLPAVKADNDVMDGLRVTARALKERRIVICRTCPDCLREMELYCWEDSAARERPRKENDHAMDDMRYFAMSVEDEGGFAATWVERRR